MVMIGNREIPMKDIASLHRWFECEWKEEDEVLLRLRNDTYTREHVKEIIWTLQKMQPDELTVEKDGRIRLWWD